MRRPSPIIKNYFKLKSFSYEKNEHCDIMVAEHNIDIIQFTEHDSKITMSFSSYNSNDNMSYYVSELPNFKFTSQEDPFKKFTRHYENNLPIYIRRSVIDCLVETIDVPNCCNVVLKYLGSTHKITVQGTFEELSKYIEYTNLNC
jgi:hypothetical protein